ncbi:hypothetical protein ACFP81_14350 [Deinococcus lacus]|uniref:Polysaccharide biosynthesis protein n=1 Tax=Deinococcus lacus TaxID=392561 RepID=A0ABW1YFF4_9DEIO
MARRVSTLMGGTLAGQLAVLAVTPLLTRLYSPEAFNDFGLYMALSGIFSVLATLRLEAAVPLAHTDTDALGLTRLALQSSAGTAVAAALFTVLALHLGWLTAAAPLGSGRGGWFIRLAYRSFSGTERPKHPA